MLTTTTQSPMNTLELTVRDRVVDATQELIDSYSALVVNQEHMRTILDEHMKSQTEAIAESFSIFEQGMARRAEKAKEFCQGKSADDLKIYLADQPVAYNLWKEADYDTLVKLVTDIYDDQVQ